MKWWAWATLAASMIRGRVFIGSPRPMFTRTESVKTRSACRTVATWARTESRVTSRRSWPSIRMRPDRGSINRGIKQARASLASSSSPMMAVREPAGISTETPSSSRRPERLSSSTFSKRDLLLEGVQEVGADVLMKLGPPLEELEDPAGRPIGLADRLSHPEPLRDRIGQPGERDQQDQHRRDRDLLVDDDIVAQQAQRDRQRGSVEQARARVDRRAGDDPPCVGLADTARGARRTAGGRTRRRHRSGRSAAGPGLRGAGKAGPKRRGAQPRSPAGRRGSRPARSARRRRPSDARKIVRSGETRSAITSRPPART